MRSKRIALTGGIASGKSTVARMFAELGAVILDADTAAREAVMPGSPALRRLRNLLDPAFFLPDGQLKRRELRDAIIADAALRSKVNAILHPPVMEILEKRWTDSRRDQPDRIVIFDIPLLFEADMAGGFDLVILVYVPAQVQIDRLMLRDGLTRSEAEKTLTMQLPIEDKRTRADIVIDNGSTRDETSLRVGKVWMDLTRSP